MAKRKKEINSMFNVLNSEFKGKKTKGKSSKKSSSSGRKVNSSKKSKSKKNNPSKEESGLGFVKVIVFFAVAFTLTWMIFMPAGSLSELTTYVKDGFSQFVMEMQQYFSSEEDYNVEAQSQITETSLQTTTSTTITTKNTTSQSQTTTTSKTSATQKTTTATKLFATTDFSPSKIDVYLKSQLVVIYNDDDEVIKAFKCSSGKSSTPTRTGDYTIHHQYRWRLMIGDCYAQYASAFSGSYLFHSVPYDKQDASTMYNAAYDKLGSPASAGCIRLCCRDAKWIYDNCNIGIKVKVVDKKAPQGIEGEAIPSRIKKAKYSGWDPTDPSSDNPYNQ